MKPLIYVLLIFLNNQILAQVKKEAHINRVERLNAKGGIYYIEKADTVYIVKLIPVLNNPPLYLVGFSQELDSTGVWVTIYKLSPLSHLSAYTVDIKIRFEEPIIVNDEMPRCNYLDCDNADLVNMGSQGCNKNSYSFAGQVVCASVIKLTFRSKTIIHAKISGVIENRISTY